jgi:hypothetical protein
VQISTTIFSYGVTAAGTKNSASKNLSSADEQTPTQPANEATSATSPGSDVEQEFLKYAHMDPIDRMRANILKSMGLTEQDLQNMTPQQRQGVEQKIKDLLEQELHKNADKKGQLVDVSA